MNILTVVAGFGKSTPSKRRRAKNPLGKRHGRLTGILNVAKTAPHIADQAITDWRTNPRYCRGLAFLRAHAVMLMARQLWPL